MDENNNIYIIVVAAGRGSRFGSDLPKQYCMLGDRPVLCHTLTNLRRTLPGATVITVVSPDMRDYWLETAARFDTDPGLVVAGGSSRWESVRNALDSIGHTDAGSMVLVHDGARPLVDTVTVRHVVDAIGAGRSVVPVVSVTDSLRLITDDAGNSSPVDRASYRAVVTPQGFMLGDLVKAYTLPFSPAFTDDASVMAAAGMTDTVLVDSFPTNIKITNPGDIALAEWYISQDTCSH